ncbi:MAG: glycosyltransferase family 4 protein [Candidatus Cloacimonadaceae bacterium]
MKALFIMPTASSFMKTDLEILGDIMPTKGICLHQNRGKAKYLLNVIKMVFILFFSPKTKLALCWFADYHAAAMAFTCKLLRKKSIVILGGYDSVHYPEFAYGVYHHKWRSRFAGYALKNCSHIIAIHEDLLDSDNLYYNPDGHPEGVFRLVKGLKTPASVLHNCLTKEPQTKPLQTRKKQILCVGTTPRFQDFYNKGYDMLIAAARAYQDWKFIFVGIGPRWLPKIEEIYQLSELKNIEINSLLPHERVLELMAESDIYAQISISEGMPYSLVEAMFMGCKPIGSNVTGIPTIMGDWGVLCTKRDEKKVIQALSELMAQDIDRETMSADIKRRFSPSVRAKKLAEIIKEVI